MRTSVPSLVPRRRLALALWTVTLLLTAPLFLLAQQPSPADRALQDAMESAGKDRVALARNLEEYLRRFPDSPRRGQVYRALVEVCLQLGDRERAVDFAERFIALAPDDSAMMLLAAELLEEAGGEHDLTRAVGYLTRILDRVEKEEAPPADAGPEWSEGRSRLLTAVYLARARLEITRRRYEVALADLRAARAISPTAEGELRMAEVAELSGDYSGAVDHYVAAYVMPDTVGRGVDRAAVYRRLTNAWLLRVGSEQGLTERIVAEFKRVHLPPPAPRPVYNAGLTDPLAFRLRRPGGGQLAMADYRGKLLVLHFWATWSLPSREVQLLLEQVAARFRERGDVAFLALSIDTEEQAVADYLKRTRVRIPVAYADGLERVFQVPAVPMVLVVSNGRVVHRRPGFVRERWVEELHSAIERNLGKQ